MRIAVVNQHLRDVVGGSELQCHLIAAGLQQLGHEVHYVVPSARPDELDLSGLPYATLAVDQDPRVIARGCVSAGSEVVYWRRNRLGLGRFAEVLREAGVPLVFATAHVDDVHRWPQRDWPEASRFRDLVADARVRVAERASWSAFAAVAAVALQREDFRGLLPVEDQRLVRNILDPSWSEPQVEPAWSWPRPYVIWAGRLQRRKRPDELPALAAVLAEHGVDLVVAGAVADAHAARFVAGDDAPGNLHHVGLLSAEDLRAALAGAHALIMTAREEGMSNVMIQAWAMGTPVVSLSYDPDGLIARHGLGVVAGGDRHAFRAAAVDLALGDRADVVTRDAIVAFATRTFDAERSLRDLERLLRDVVARGVAVEGRRRGSG